MKLINLIPLKEISSKVPKMYVKYLAVQNKVRELEEKQKEMAAKYFKEKNYMKRDALLADLKKGTAQLASYRRNLADIEEKYIDSMASPDEY